MRDIPHLPEIVDELLSQPDFVQRLREFRSSCVYNWGNAGPVAARLLLELRASVRAEGGRG